MTGWDPAAAALVEQLPKLARGPKREGVFALWLTVRVAQDLLLDPPVAERAHRRRLDALGRRLSSLTIPTPLRRALVTAIDQLQDATPTAAARVLSQLVAPAREVGGAAIGDVMAAAARAAARAV